MKFKQTKITDYLTLPNGGKNITHKRVGSNPTPNPHWFKHSPKRSPTPARSPEIEALLGPLIGIAKRPIFDKMIELSRGFMVYDMGLAYDLRGQPPARFYDLMLDRIARDNEFLIELWFTGEVAGLGRMLMDFTRMLTGAEQKFQLWKEKMIETAFSQRIQAYWNYEFYPNLPDEKLAWNLWLEEQITTQDRNEYFRYAGWEPKWHPKLEAVWDKDPSSKDAFYMWMKEIITDQERNKLYKIDGYLKNWHEKITLNFYRWPEIWEAFLMWRRGAIAHHRMIQTFKAHGFPEEWHRPLEINLYRYPSMFDIFRLADTVPLDPIWLAEMYKLAGYRDEDIPYFVEATEKRPLREEYRAITRQLIWMYRHGRISREDLEGQFVALGLLKRERELNLRYADLIYQSELIDEWIEILRWYHRQAWITSEDFKDRLVKLGIRKEKANLIVELERAKGYFGKYY